MNSELRGLSFPVLSLLLLVLLFSSQTAVAWAPSYYKVSSTFDNQQIVWDPTVELFIVASHGSSKINSWNPTTFATALLAGTGTALTLDNALGSLAQIDTPSGVTLLISDNAAHDIIGYLVVSQGGNVLRSVSNANPYATATLAGNYLLGAATVDGTGTAARFAVPATADYHKGSGMMAVAQMGASNANAYIRKVLYNSAGSNGIVSILAGRGTATPVADGAATTAAQFNMPYAVAFFPTQRRNSDCVVHF